MKKSNELKFSALKIKKIIQENKDIGKIANMTPYVISKSLEYFLKDLLCECATIAQQEGTSKVSAYHIKRVIETNPNLTFLSDIVEEITEDKTKKKEKKKNSNK